MSSQKVINMYVQQEDRDNEDGEERRGIRR